MNATAKKRFGQNFLNDEFVIAQIINLINPQFDDFMVEIGPGRGALTHPLSESLKQLHVIELDRDIVKLLHNTQFAHPVIIHSHDALKFDYTFKEKPQLRVAGNLPYNISTPLLFHLAQFDNITDMHFMLQKEVVERICASPNNKDYGRLSVMLQYRFNCIKLLDVSCNSFTPVPKVESALIRLKPKPLNLWQHINEKKLNHIVTTAFNQRRKTITNSLKNLFDQDILASIGIDCKKRAENLSVAEYVKLTTI
ncbi:MAG: 16S rRNA (adenine(1518)-N(6)/adenine(1519)-N(6))-dimethyltransferase RsmA [Burkholderiales bacterium]|nr:16S rRNA (adenine(1518)-N(6)/adenine(1519)-N(6))-dimethyltransferase RsmA [Burkholderiales bacterium]